MSGYIMRSYKPPARVSAAKIIMRLFASHTLGIARGAACVPDPMDEWATTFG
jgi:hypothetical protein